MLLMKTCLVLVRTCLMLMRICLRLMRTCLMMLRTSLVLVRTCLVLVRTWLVLVRACLVLVATKVNAQTLFLLVRVFLLTPHHLLYGHHWCGPEGDPRSVLGRVLADTYTSSSVEFLDSWTLMLPNLLLLWVALSSHLDVVKLPIRALCKCVARGQLHALRLVLLLDVVG